MLFEYRVNNDIIPVPLVDITGKLQFQKGVEYCACPLTKILFGLSVIIIDHFKIFLDDIVIVIVLEIERGEHNFIKRNAHDFHSLYVGNEFVCCQCHSDTL